MEFLTLLNDNNDWLDWIDGRYESVDDVEGPKEFPCYVGDEDFYDMDENELYYVPIFYYAADLREMLDKLEG